MRGLFSNIESRLPNTSRPEYLEILNTYDLEPNASQIEILKKTKGRLLTDNFDLVVNKLKMKCQTFG